MESEMDCETIIGKRTEQTFIYQTVLGDIKMLE